MVNEVSAHLGDQGSNHIEEKKHLVISFYVPKPGGQTYQVYVLVDLAYIWWNSRGARKVA